MLRLSIWFFIISLIAAMLGYSNIAGTALDFAKILFFICLIPAIILLFVGILFVGSSK